MGALHSTLATTCECCISRDEKDDVIPIDQDLDQSEGNPEQSTSSQPGVQSRLLPTRSKAPPQRSHQQSQLPGRRPSNRTKATSTLAPTSSTVENSPAEKRCRIDSFPYVENSTTEVSQITPKEAEVQTFSIADNRETEGGNGTALQNHDSLNDDGLALDLSEALELIRNTDRSSINLGDQDEDVMEILQMLKAMEADEKVLDSPDNVSTEPDDERDTSTSSLSIARSSDPRESPSPWTWEVDAVRSRLRSTASIQSRRKSSAQPTEIALARSRLRAVTTPPLSHRSNGTKTSEPQEAQDQAKWEQLKGMLRTRPGLLKHLSAKLADDAVAP